MEVLDIIRQIIAERKAERRQPLIAPRPEIYKRWSHPHRLPEMDRQIDELLSYGMIEKGRTINSIYYKLTANE